MRTNIDLNDELIQEVLQLSGLKTKKDAVNEALTEYIWNHNRKNLAELRGAIAFSDGYDYKAARRRRL
jgi:Arc/MetJ family transcription regulator